MLRLYPDIDAMRNVDNVVIWSGGADSTLIVVELATRLKEIGKELYTLSITSVHLSVEKQLKEKESRDIILRELREKGCDIRDETLQLNLATLSLSHGDGIPQALMWSMMCLPMMKNNSNIFLGYHKGDDFWYWSHDFETTIQSAAKIVEKSVQLCIPLAYKTKADIIKDLDELSIRDYWFCESPTVSDDTKPEIIRCNTCLPCKTYDKAIRELEVEGSGRFRVEPTSERELKSIDTCACRDNDLICTCAKHEPSAFERSKYMDVVDSTPKVIKMLRGLNQ